MNDRERKAAHAWNHIKQAGSALVKRGDALLPGYRELKRMGIVTINGTHAQLTGEYRRSFLAGEDLPSWADLSSTRPTARLHATKKSPAQLDREITEVVPGWARGLDLSEARSLAQRLPVSQAELEAKQRRIESDRRAALPSLSITEAGSGIFVRVSSPGLGYGKYHAVADALKAFQLPIGNAIAPNIFVPVHKAADKTKARKQVEEALRYAGYRI